MQQPRYSLPFAASVILHVTLLLGLAFTYEFSSVMPVLENSDQDMKVISAMIINSQATVPVEAPRPAAQPDKPHEAELPKPKPVPKDVVPVVSHQQTAAEIEEQMLAVGETLKSQLLTKQAANTKKLLQEKKLKAAKEKKLKQAALLKSMEMDMKDSAAKSLQQQLINEQQRAVGVKVRGEVDKYKALILQAISQQWLVPAGVDKTLSSVLLIRLAPGGTVLDVQVTKSSGDVALDRSARDAVFKASPLPVPEDEAGLEQFRLFQLKVKPENLIANDA